jgi:subtilisin family serine protease
MVESTGEPLTIVVIQTVEVTDPGTPTPEPTENAVVIQQVELSATPTDTAAPSETPTEVSPTPVPEVQALVTTPNDTGYPLQYGLVSINAPLGWDTSTGSSAVIVAVVDTGIDLTHPDLASKLTNGYDFVQGDTDPSDANSHGTHVAGIIAAVTNNGAGVAGVSWNAQIMPVRVLDASGNGSIVTLADGINWAVANGADVINLSVGIDPLTPPNKLVPLQAAIQNAIANGVVVVAAVGNTNSAVMYPAIYPEVIAVAASDNTDARAPYSNYGSEVDVTAPGSNIYSTCLATCAGGIYSYKTGTSMSAGYVSGEAAILVGLRPDLTPAQIAYVIEQSAKDIDAPGIDNNTGYGIIQLNSAITLVMQMPYAPPTPSATATTVASSSSQQSTTITIIVTDETPRGFTPSGPNQGNPPASSQTPGLPVESPAVSSPQPSATTPAGAVAPTSPAVTDTPAPDEVIALETESPALSAKQSKSMTGWWICSGTGLLFFLLFLFFFIRRRRAGQ